MSANHKRSNKTNCIAGKNTSCVDRSKGDTSCIDRSRGDTSCVDRSKSDTSCVDRSSDLTSRGRTSPAEVGVTAWILRPDLVISVQKKPSLLEGCRGVGKVMRTRCRNMEVMSCFRSNSCFCSNSIARCDNIPRDPRLSHPDPSRMSRST